MNAATRLVEAEASALSAEQRQADFERHQADRRRRVAGLAGNPAIAPEDVADAGVWMAAYAEGIRLREAVRLVAESRNPAHRVKMETVR